MHRRLILVGVLAMALAGCGGSSSSSSPSASSGASTSPSAAASRSPGPLASNPPAAASPSASLPAAGSTAAAICDGISLRKQASSSGAKVKTISSGTAVHVVATVTGSAYTAGSCGTSGNTWLKIDKVAGKTAKSAFGVQYVYAAAGFFQ